MKIEWTTVSLLKMLRYCQHRRAVKTDIPEDSDNWARIGGKDCEVPAMVLMDDGTYVAIVRWEKGTNLGEKYMIGVPKMNVHVIPCAGSGYGNIMLRSMAGCWFLKQSFDVRRNTIVRIIEADINDDGKIVQRGKLTDCI